MWPKKDKTEQLLAGAKNGDADAARNAHIACHAANVALYLDRQVTFDPETNEFKEMSVIPPLDGAIHPAVDGALVFEFGQQVVGNKRPALGAAL